MKAFKYSYAFLLLVFVLPFTACNDTEDGSFVAPITIYEKIQGNWTVTSVKQVDEIAKANSQTPSEMILTDQFNFSGFTISLSVDESNQPTSYKVGGSAPKLFASEGYWDLVYPYPNTDGTASTINLYSDAAKSKKTGTLDIMAIPGSTKVLELKLTRKTKGVPFTSYIYQLAPVNK